MPFLHYPTLPVRQLFGGSIRGRYGHTDQMTLGVVELDTDTEVPPHQHPHEQVTYVVEGRFDFFIGDERQVLEAGMAALIPGGVTHGGRTLTPCRVLDVFSPVREDYR